MSDGLAERVERWMVGQMPIIQMHGGTSVVREADADAGRVVVELGGTCSGCGISDLTAQNIKRDLTMDFDQVEEVVVRVPSSGDVGESTVEGGRGGDLKPTDGTPDHF